MISLTLLLTVTSKEVNAGPFSDTLGKCLVRSVTQVEKINLSKWMFFAMGDHPSLEFSFEVSDSNKVSVDKSTADIMTRLMFHACKQEFKDALKYERKSGYQTAFALLGKVAARELMTDPKVTEALGGFVKFMDHKKVRELLAN
jgi:hypothetical protein